MEQLIEPLEIGEELDFIAAEQDPPGHGCTNGHCPGGGHGCTNDVCGEA